jgi:hypothetical protein
VVDGRCARYENVALLRTLDVFRVPSPGFQRECLDKLPFFDEKHVSRGEGEILASPLDAPSYTPTP